MTAWCRECELHLDPYTQVLVHARDGRLHLKCWEAKRRRLAA